jgi:hypothetical protein
MAKRKPTPEERRKLREAFASMRSDVGELRALFERVADRLRQAEAEELRRRERLRRLTFGLLGR